MPAKSDLTLVVTRIFDAPADRVFDAWLDPKHMGQWLFKTPTGKMTHVTCDPRVGGGFEVFEQRGGELAKHYGTFVQLDRPRKLAFDFWTSHSDLKTRVTIEVAPLANGCVLTLTHQIDPFWISHLDSARHGWTMIAEALAANLGEPADFIISRAFDATPETLFACGTEPARIARWWGPQGFTTPECIIDLRAGGKYRLAISAPDGTRYPATGEYREVVRPTKLAFTMDVTEHPPAWQDLVKPNRSPSGPNPAGIFHYTITFDREDAKTRVTIRTQFEQEATRSALLRMGISKAWFESLDRLATEANT